MRLILAISIIIISLITLALAGYYYIEQSTKELQKLLQDLDNSIRASNWQQASRISSQLNKKWQQKKNYILLIKDHGELHDLDITLTRIKSLIEIKNQFELLSELLIARKLVDNIRQQEKFSLQSIF